MPSSRGSAQPRDQAHVSGHWQKDSLPLNHLGSPNNVKASGKWRGQKRQGNERSFWVRILNTRPWLWVVLTSSRRHDWLPVFLQRAWEHTRAFYCVIKDGWTCASVFFSLGKKKSTFMLLNYLLTYWYNSILCQEYYIILVPRIFHKDFSFRKGKY